MSSCFDGCRWSEDSRIGPQTRIKKRWKPENSPGAGRNLSFTFFGSEASVGVRREDPNEIQSPLLPGKGERCMKDTVHPAVQRSVHLFGTRTL